MGPQLPEVEPGLQEALPSLVPSCWSCPRVSRAVKEGMEPRVDVKATSKLCDSFCSWDTGPDKRCTDHDMQREVQQKGSPWRTRTALLTWNGCKYKETPP